MRDLSIEEKAKAYDKAKSIVEKYLKSGNAGVIAENTIKKAFPELSEPEDERIRKEIRDFICWATDRGSITKEQREQSNSWLAWLEKQKVTASNEDIEKMRNVAIQACQYMVDNFENSTKQYEDAIAWLEKQGNLMKALQISNARIGELIEKNYYLKEQLEKQCEQKPAWSEEAMKYLKENHSSSEVSDFQAAMNIAVAKAYDKGKADAIAEMSIWSEEDEKIIRALISICDEWAIRHSYLPKDDNDIDKIKNWLNAIIS